MFPRCRRLPQPRQHQPPHRKVTQLGAPPSSIAKALAQPGFKHLLRVATGVGITDALARVEFEDSLWAAFTAKEEFAGIGFRDCQVIPLRGPQQLQGVSDSFEAVNYPNFESHSFIPYANLMILMTHLLGIREIGRISLIRVRPNGCIYPRTDKGAYARYYAQFLLVLSAPPQFRLQIGHEGINPAQGELWWFNHQKEYWAKNSGAKPFIALTFGAAAPGFTGAVK